MSTGVVMLLALAVSIDGFSAGFSCGIRRLIVPFASLLVICLSSVAAVACSMFLGERVVELLFLDHLALTGGIVLMLLGLYVFYQYRQERKSGKENDGQLARRESGSFNRISSMVWRPQQADLDNSGVLSAGEAVLLGLALAADAFAAGFAAALIGLPLLFTVAAVGIAKLLLVPLGIWTGRLLAGKISLKPATLLSGFILIFIGIITVLHG